MEDTYEPSSFLFFGSGDAGGSGKPRGLAPATESSACRRAVCRGASAHGDHREPELHQLWLIDTTVVAGFAYQRNRAWPLLLAPLRHDRRDLSSWWPPD